VLVGDVHRIQCIHDVRSSVYCCIRHGSLDLGFDPSASTIHHNWIWEQGGGYFGVPFTNYLGGLHRVCFLPIVCPLSCVSAGLAAKRRRQLSPGRTNDQVLIMYTVIGLAFVVSLSVGGSNRWSIRMQPGVVWHTASIAEAQGHGYHSLR